MKCWKIRHSRKGISTIVGGFIFMILMVGAFTAFIAAIQFHQGLIVSQAKVSTTEIGKAQEEFTAGASVEDNRLTLSVANTGSVDLEIDNLWFINKSDPGDDLLREINYDEGLIAIGSTVDILNGADNGIKDGTYNLKIVSSRGNFEIIEDFIVKSGGIGGTDCEVKTYVVPPNVAVAGNATLIMQVFNRGTNTIFDLEPDGDPTVTPSSAVLGKKLTSPSSINELRGGESVLFAWNYKLTGAVGSSVEFDVSAQGKTTDDEPLFDVQCDTSETITKIVEAQQDQVLQQELSAKPEIFAIIAGPIGESENDDSRMFFGVIVVNPTNQTMTVNRVSIMFNPSDADGNQEVVDDGESDMDHIHPSDNGICVGCTGGGNEEGEWEVPEDNALIWNADPIESPVTIDPFSAEQFVVKIKVDDLDDDLLVVVTINAYTSFGQFAKSGYMTHGDDDQDDITIVNVYPTSRSVTGTSSEGTADDDEFAAIRSVTGGTTNSFYVTVREGQDSGGGGSGCPTGGNCPRILANEATLVINLPPGFPVVTAASGQTGFGTPTTLIFQDGAQQIRAPITSALGDTTSDVERFTFTFSATAPTVDEIRMYIIYSLITGNDVDNNPLGAISEAYLVIVDSP